MIKKLPQDLINKIAAGEVVERPSSVVKELVENSIDANADQINIEIKNGGIDYIQIQDNGLGMSKEDAKLAVEQHATSKISTIEDLFNIQTMGFRGEALASISAVSQFELQTKVKDSNEGTKLEIRNSKLEINACGCPDGTKIIIKDLFYNVPARQKFLKSPITEYNHILELISNFALINPQISWKFTHNNKLILNLPKTKAWIERIKQVLGSDTADNLISIEQKGSVYINGYIGKPQAARNNRKSQFVFINNRIVNDYLISKAVKEGFGSLIPHNVYPTFILSLQIPAELVDVNVHPRKAEVKFKNSQEIYVTVLQAVQKNLVQKNLTHQINVDTAQPHVKYSLKPNTTEIASKPQITYQPSFKNIKTKPSQVSQAMDFSKEFLNNQFTENTQTEKIGDWKLLGQIHKAYLLVEAPQGILIIDQHAAAERVIYEKFKKYYKSENVKSQRLLMPFNIELSARETEILNQSMTFLQGLGFDIDIFGNNSFKINAVPQEIVKLDVKSTILGLINDLEDGFSQSKSLDEKKDLILKYAACRAAIKFQDKIESPEQIKLLEDILEIIDNINTCPHGRPFVMELTLEQLAKNFKRK